MKSVMYYKRSSICTLQKICVPFTYHCLRKETGLNEELVASVTVLMESFAHNYRRDFDGGMSNYSCLYTVAGEWECNP
jgi:hypothetical protein